MKLFFEFIFKTCHKNNYIYQIPILTYHSLSGRGSDYISSQAFLWQLDFFKRNEIITISVSRLIDYILKANRVMEGPCVVLTFDDGYEDFYQQVFPIIEKRKIQVALFLIVKNIGSDNYLSLRQLRELARSKYVTIGSHSMTHSCGLVGLSRSRVQYEIRDSKLCLEELLGRSVDFFAYPWGIFSEEIKSIVEETGYQAAFTTNVVFPKKKDIYCIPRLAASENDNYLKFCLKTSGLANCFARRMPKSYGR